ncbi:XF1762 family protein [Nocardiopsis synnemataformans]|uniref:XF1762 family protein n=1 Tax=Nocardiopsis synnemataformans TaxID=61305 RepID=UPI003EC0BE36
MKLSLIPVPLVEAKAFIEVWHRHLKPPRGHKFSLGVVGENGVLVAVAVVGRPVARGLDDGRTLEVTRMASDGTSNACSMLYAASWRATRALGYRRLVTYTRADETGASLRAAGWKQVAALPPRESWHPPRQPRAEGVPRIRWQAP